LPYLSWAPARVVAPANTAATDDAVLSPNVVAANVTAANAAAAASQMSPEEAINPLKAAPAGKKLLVYSPAAAPDFGPRQLRPATAGGKVYKSSLTSKDANRWNSGNTTVTGACGNNTQCISSSRCRCCYK